MISLYEELIYDEDVRIKQPELYIGRKQNTSEKYIKLYGQKLHNRSCEHFKTTNFKLMESIFEIAGLPKEDIKNHDSMILSILWNFPRKYNETKQWVCLSGFFYSSEDFNGTSKGFVVSDNSGSKENQQNAIEIIKLINKFKNEN